MFKIEKDPKFWATVTALTPIDDGHSEDTFRARFKVHPAEFVENFDVTNGDDICAFLRETVIDLDEIVDDTDKPIAFSPELLETMLGNYGARMAMLNTYVMSVVKAKLGN